MTIMAAAVFERHLTGPERIVRRLSATSFGLRAVLPANNVALLKPLLERRALL